MKISSIGFTALTATFALAVSAQTVPPPKSDIAASPDSTATTDTVQFGTVDQNRDGRISRAEAMSHSGQLGSAFSSLDLDRDAYLTQSEFGKWAPTRKAEESAKPTTASDLAMPDSKSSTSATRTPATGQ